MMEMAGMAIGFIAVIGGLGISGIAIVQGIRFSAQKRELEHIERMKAFEFGRNLPQDEPWLTPMKLAAVIGGLVPISAFASVAQATASAGFHEEMWIAAVMVAVASVICGSIVAIQSRRPNTADQPATAKPYVAEDAYDVVSSRG